jgi:hypothetical protein
MFRISKRLLCSALTPKIPKVLFADTNVLIGCTSGEYDWLTTKLLDSTIHYTETVASEYKESMTDPLPDNFVYVASGLSDTLKDAAYIDLITRWKLPTMFTTTQIERFRNDIFIVFESSYARFSTDSRWTPELGHAPYLLTNNLKLYHKFLDSKLKQDLLDLILNKWGMEHLIPVVTIDKIT